MTLTCGECRNRLCPKIGENQADLGQIWPISVEFGRNWATRGRITWSNSGQCRPNLAQVPPELAKSGTRSDRPRAHEMHARNTWGARVRAHDRNKYESGTATTLRTLQSWPDSAPTRSSSWPDSAPTRASAHIWSSPAQIWPWSKLARRWPNSPRTRGPTSTDVYQRRPHVCQSRPGFDQIRAK